MNTQSLPMEHSEALDVATWNGRHFIAGDVIRFEVTRYDHRKNESVRELAAGRLVALYVDRHPNGPNARIYAELEDGPRVWFDRDRPQLADELAAQMRRFELGARVEWNRGKSRPATGTVRRASIEDAVHVDNRLPIAPWGTYLGRTLFVECDEAKCGCHVEAWKHQVNECQLAPHIDVPPSTDPDALF
jgi:hypothetical protein